MALAERCAVGGAGSGFVDVAGGGEDGGATSATSATEERAVETATRRMSATVTATRKLATRVERSTRMRSECWRQRWGGAKWSRRFRKMGGRDN